MEQGSAARPSTESRVAGERAERQVREALESCSVSGDQQDAVVETLRSTFRFRDDWSHGRLVESGLLCATYDGTGTSHVRAVLQEQWVKQ